MGTHIVIATSGYNRKAACVNDVTNIDRLHANENGASWPRRYASDSANQGAKKCLIGASTSNRCTAKGPNATIDKPAAITVDGRIQRS